MKFGILLFYWALSGLVLSQEEVEDSCIVYLPNTITPDCDGYCDGLFVESNCEIENYQLIVYNRWAEILYKSYSIKEEWDGQVNGEWVTDGTYTWHLSGNFPGELPFLKKGTVTVIK